MPQTSPPQSVTGPSNMGYIASPVAYLPTPRPPTPLPIGHGSWPTFNKALNLAQRLGVRPSIETLKTLEVAETQKADDPRPNKRSRIQFEGLPRGEALGQKGKAKAAPKDDDVVSLGYTEDEEMGRVGSDIADDNIHAGVLIENLKFSWALSGACTYFAQDFNQAHRGGSV